MTRRTWKALSLAAVTMAILAGVWLTPLVLVQALTALAALAGSLWVIYRSFVGLSYRGERGDLVVRRWRGGWFVYWRGGQA